MVLGVIFILILYTLIWPNFDCNAIDYDFRPNFHPNSNHFDFGLIFYRNTIDYDFRPNFHANTIHSDFGLILIVII